MPDIISNNDYIYLAVLSNEDSPFSISEGCPWSSCAVLCESGDPIEGWRGSGSFVETGKLVNRSGGAESQNRRRPAKFSRLVETVRARVELCGENGLSCPRLSSLSSNPPPPPLTNPADRANQTPYWGKSHLWSRAPRQDWMEGLRNVD